VSELASLPWLRLSLPAGADQLLVMHNVAAMVTSSGRRSLPAAAAAAKCPSGELGRERPSISAPRFRPRALMPGSLTPQLPICHCLGACPVSIVFSSAPPARRLGVLRLAHVPRKTNLSIVRPPASICVTPAIVCAAITQRSFELCSAPCKARRFASAHARGPRVAFGT
jgi:hypothetical protein